MRAARFEVVVDGGVGERQNVCFGETYETRGEAALALDVLVSDGRVDADGPFAGYVAEVSP